MYISVLLLKSPVDYFIELVVDGVGLEDVANLDVFLESPHCSLYIDYGIV